jgi:succinylglutamic semialdehyde dehydrogenase
MQKILAALVAGNAVLFKPSEHTPACGAAIAELFLRAGLPDHVLGLVHGGPEVGQELVAHPDIDGLIFTGKVTNGLAIHKALAGRPDRLCALEMGGNNPIVVWDVPDLRAAATLIVQSAYLRSGQDCLAARRLIVKDDLADPLIEEIVKIIDRLIIDEPLASPAPFMGPVIGNRAADELSQAFLDLMMAGGKPIRHLARPRGELPFLSPALIDVTHASPGREVELFGPILQLTRVSRFEHAIAHANASHYGLSSALVGGTPEHYEMFQAQLHTGIVNWNRPTNRLSVAAPIGGLRFSGNHRPGGGYTADLCSYPMIAAETEQLRAFIGTGLRPVDTSVMGD